MVYIGMSQPMQDAALQLGDEQFPAFLPAAQGSNAE
jgi:hypothetical protein